jgi:tight adherence protein C
MNVFLVAIDAALGMAGVLLMVRGLVGVTTPLSAVVAELHRPRHPATTRRRRAQFVEQLVGKRTPKLESDLAMCERSPAKYVQDRFVWALLFAAPGLAITLLAVAGTVSWATPALGLVAIAAGAVGGWLWARADLASDAVRDRLQFRHALAAYLELVTILLSGGAGVETAMFDAVAAGRGPAFRHLRSSLSAAQARREAPWRTLGELGRRLGVGELEELEASMTLAGGGAQVRESLTAKAAGIRMKDLSRLESEAQSRSETMVLPVALMFAGFLVLIGYPALAALSTP